MDARNEVEETCNPVSGSVNTSFICSLCELYSNYDYYGTQPLQRMYQTDAQQAAKQSQNKEKFVLFEKSYICNDPFSEIKSNNFLILGANCCICNKRVCVSDECSFFYFSKRFCLKCASNTEIDSGEFPTEIQDIIEKYKKKISNT